MKSFLLAVCACLTLVACEADEPIVFDGGPGGGIDVGPAADAGPGTDVGPGGDAGTCNPICETRTCGNDGCGGECGTCGGGESCRDDGVCVVVEDGCEPSCFQKLCGDDGCGGSCGECATGSGCESEPWHRSPSVSRRFCAPPTRDFGSSAVCPPTEVAGSDPGMVVLDAQVLECGTNFPVNHRGMCAEPVSLVYQINVDCAPCVAYVNTVLGPLQEEYGSDLQVYVVFDEPGECGDVGFFGSTTTNVRFMYQPPFEIAGIFGTGGKDSTMVMYEGNVLVSYAKKPTEESLRMEIEAGLN